MARHDPELIIAFEANRTAIDAAREHEQRTCPCTDCVDARWQAARDEEFDDRWNARMNP